MASDDIFTARLFRVDDTGITQIGSSEKRGNCAHDGILLRWDDTFFAEAMETNDSGGDCSGLVTDSPAGIRIGLSRGWADVYAQSLPDQYFDFTGLGIGAYLVRFTVDADGLIRELSDSNNSGYTLFKVTSSVRPGAFEILERGRGRDHLDPNKVPLFGIAE